MRVKLGGISGKNVTGKENKFKKALKFNVLGVWDRSREAKVLRAP